ncbi:MAG: DUF1592 domain-containing protein, partial [Planctomycetota bacterium]
MNLPTKCRVCFTVVSLFTLLTLLARAEEPIPAKVQAFLSKHCTDCHSETEPAAELSLNLDSIDLSRREQSFHWEQVLEVVGRGIMPPSDEPRPGAKDLESFLAWLNAELVSHGPIGGTYLRRLSNRELRNSIRDLTGLVDFELPTNFPPDTRTDGFDNLSAGMDLAPAHMEALFDTAHLVADQYFPAATMRPKVSSHRIAPEDLVISYSSACLIDGSMRLASSGSNERRNSTWPAKFVSPATGSYKVRVRVTGTAEVSEVEQKLEVSTMDPNGRKQKKLLGEFELKSNGSEQQWIEFETRIPKSHTLVFRYSNAPLNYDDKKLFRRFLLELFKNDIPLAAAWSKIGEPARGGSGWQRVQEAMAESDLDVKTLRDDPKLLEKIATKYSGNSVLTGETLVYKYFENGPYIAINEIIVEGPFAVEAEGDSIAAKKRAEEFLGASGRSEDPNNWKRVLRPFMQRAFRGPVKQRELEQIVELMQIVMDERANVDDAYHLAIRSILFSPRFLFRAFDNERQDGLLDHYGLASRLSYFLRSSAPDDELLQAAGKELLFDQDKLLMHARRILSADNKTASSVFATDFVVSWLGLEGLETLMPDPRLIKDYDGIRTAVQNEPVMTFEKILRENRSARDLIAPEFVL